MSFYFIILVYIAKVFVSDHFRMKVTLCYCYHVFDLHYGTWLLIILLPRYNVQLTCRTVNVVFVI